MHALCPAASEIFLAYGNYTRSTELPFAKLVQFTLISAVAARRFCTVRISSAQVGCLYDDAFRLATKSRQGLVCLYRTSRPSLARILLWRPVSARNIKVVGGCQEEQHEIYRRNSILEAACSSFVAVACGCG
jgi:hypothetical protein